MISLCTLFLRPTGRYLDDTARNFRLQLKQAMQVRAPKGKSAPAPSPPEPPTSATIWIAKAYPPWQVKFPDIFIPWVVYLSSLPVVRGVTFATIDY
ncbi:unnamed protein product [Dibothriocephalus latus]|uniref:Uncharacterized protein n=1 Tax=Dibothriocephalus latus TaxID=60516 RepID=A0A3P7NRI4_DIBLA|nr:unnamed protein product [Dibothriocephalus latus]